VGSGADVVDGLVGRPPWRRAAANAAALAATAAAATWVAVGTSGGWAELGAAVVVVAFSWAAASKVLAPRRWRAAIVAVGIPEGLRPAVGRVVPAAETGVAALGLLGLHRWAGAGAIVLLGAFSGALVARWRRGERRLSCGCFGAGGDVLVGAALARNAALAVMASASWTLPRSSLDRWPGMPSAADLVPAVLAVGGLTAAVAIALASARALRRSA
jgi:hypothetical protein